MILIFKTGLVHHNLNVGNEILSRFAPENRYTKLKDLCYHLILQYLKS